MRVCLAKIAPPSGSLSNVPPLSLYQLAAAVRDAGHEPVVVDPIDESGRQRIIDECKQGLQVLGVSVDSFNWGVTRQFLCEIKQNYDHLLTVAGGIHVHHFPELVSEQECVDVAVVGPGEVPLLEIIASGSDSKLLRPIMSGEMVDPPVAAYDLIPELKYSVMPFTTSIGCPGRCVFCSVKRGHMHAYPEPHVLSRLERSCELSRGKFLFDTVFLTDDCFTGRPKRAERLLQEFEARGYRNRLAFEARIVDLLKPELRSAVSSIQPAFVQIGIECGYDEGLSKVGKDITTAQVEQCAAAAFADGWAEAATYSFIVGLPWETVDHCLKTIHFAASLVDRYGGKGSVSWFGLLPSPLWEQRAKYGITIDESMFDRPCGGNNELFFDIHPNLSAADVDKVWDTIKAYDVAGIRLHQFLWGGRP